jgi:TPP-dependent pyruvate/acetoin dehydrogenase alpha subunit
MMAETKETETTFENPLIPNARVRQIYRAMVAMRALAKALPPSKRDGLGVEACLAATSVDLGPGDLVSDALAGPVLEFLRGAPLGAVLGRDKSKRGAKADCGAAARLPVGLSVADRIWTALGAAAALKATGTQAAVAAKATGETPMDGRVVMAYVRPGEVPAALWRKALVFAREQELPLVLVVLPPAKGDKRRAGGVCTLALECGVPGIPVDADDAVAIYRVAQESIGRARIGGGVALMECVPFVIAGESGGAADGIAGLERYLLERKVATKVWMTREARTFARQVAKEKAASK